MGLPLPKALRVPALCGYSILIHAHIPPVQTYPLGEAMIIRVYVCLLKDPALPVSLMSPPKPSRTTNGAVLSSAF